MEEGRLTAGLSLLFRVHLVGLWRLRSACDEESWENSHDFSGIKYDHDLQEPLSILTLWHMLCIGPQDGSHALSSVYFSECSVFLGFNNVFPEQVLKK